MAVLYKKTKTPVVSFTNWFWRCDAITYHHTKLKALGWWWCEKDRCLKTDQLASVLPLRRFFDQSAKAHYRLTVCEKISWKKTIDAPSGVVPYAHQLQAARFALERRACYLALDAGLGKTLVAAMVKRALGQPMVYVCPSFLSPTVVAEFKRFGEAHNLKVIADSTAHKYGGRLAEFLRAHPDSVLVVDEAHRFKSNKARRSQGVYQLARIFGRVIFMSGTPMPNRPVELWPVLHHVVPHLIDHIDYIGYGKTYCAGYYDQRFCRYDFRGASNMAGLALRIKDIFMLRIRKDEVLKDLPPKIEQLVFLGNKLPPDICKMDKALTQAAGGDLVRLALAAANGKGDLHLATYRRLLGLHKVPAALKFIKSVLDDSAEAVLVFCQHTEVAKALEVGLAAYLPVVITGATPTALRQSLVSGFQNPHSLNRVLIGNIEAAGVGFTITRATRVVFVEFAYTPGVNSQAADRTHRIGQKNSVIVNFCVYRDSLDRYILSAITKKTENIDQI